jgi:transposase-like protein
MSAGRIHSLADPEFAKAVAEAFVAGASREEMCKLFNVKDPYTITRWRRDPRVKAHAMKLIEDRVIQITRKVDGAIEARLQDTGKLSIKELLDIRKEFLGGQLRAQTEKADADTTREAIDALEANPDMLEELEKLFEKQNERS